MEDRNTPGLYLEMTDTLTPDQYAATRVDDVLALSGVDRATWWVNLKRDRTDLPRVLDEFDTLGVYEIDDTFVAPATPDGITGHHFRRYPRPGQGRLTGQPTVGLSLVLISPTTPDQAQALRDWGDFVHLNWIAAVGVPGYTMITPYENVRGTGTGDDEPRYMHFYEMDTEDAETTFKTMTPLVEERFGRQGTPEFKYWGWHDALRIMYVNSFRRVGASERPRVSDFFELVHHQRAHRRFADTPVDDDTIAKLLDAAVHAPSAENRQPWEFVVVQDPEMRSTLLDFAEKAWDGGGREFAEARLTPGLIADVEHGIGGGGYRDAPVLIVVAADIQRGLEVTVPSSIFPATQNLLLAATELGLASALTTISMGFTEDLQAMLDLPAHVVPQAVIPIGHPVRRLGPSKREPFETHTHRDRYGTPW